MILLALFRTFSTLLIPTAVCPSSILSYFLSFHSTQILPFKVKMMPLFTVLIFTFSSPLLLFICLLSFLSSIQLFFFLSTHILLSKVEMILLFLVLFLFFSFPAFCASFFLSSFFFLSFYSWLYFQSQNDAFISYSFLSFSYHSFPFLFFTFLSTNNLPPIVEMIPFFLLSSATPLPPAAGPREVLYAATGGA